MSEMTPREIVSELDKHIIGQDNAKRSVAIALRNRWRRMQLNEELRHEVTPKNILMIGPTGVGKTEIARRLAKLANAPFIKVEATKFTEVGYVGKEVDSIIRDLTDAAVKMVRVQAIETPYSVVRPRLNKFDPDSVCVFDSELSLIDHISVASDRPGAFYSAVLVGRNGKINWSGSGHCVKL